MIYSIAKNSGSRRELKNIKKLKDKSSRKRYDYISDSSRNYYDSPLSRNRNGDENRKPPERREIDILDHVVIGNINKNKDKHTNNSIENDPDFDNNSFNLSSRAKYPLQLVTVSL